MLGNGIDNRALHVEPMPMWTLPCAPDTRPDWRTIDRALRAIRTSRAALDAEEMHWLRQAEAQQIWRPLGMVSALDYLERVLGYAPRTAQDRLRVARALGSLPQLTAALATDQLPFSAVRELTRVATPTTEALWISAAGGKNLRQIEELVADHRPGDRPDDPPDPQARIHVVRFELAAGTFALLRQARSVLDDEHGTNLSDDELMAALCQCVLDGAPGTEPTGRAKFQIAVTVCRSCQRGWQEGAGAQIAIDPATVDRATCDAQHIGSIDGDSPERAHQDIPPSVARFVWRRDGGRCRVDGCRSARGLELHHIIHRADGGSHDARNIILCCSRCHQSHHAGQITIAGTADELVIRRRDLAAGTAHDTPVVVAIAPSSTTQTGAHVGAAVVASSTTQTGAQVGTAADPRSTIQTGAHDLGAGAVPNSATRTGAHVGAGAAPSSTTRTGAHVGAGAAPSSATRTGAHVGAGAAPSSTTRTGAHDLGAGAVPNSATRTGAHVGAPSKVECAILCTQAKTALTGLGWKPAIAHAAVTAAAAAQGPEVTLERLIFESLRRCPVPERIA
jgi:hypothetical protein